MYNASSNAVGTVSTPQGRKANADINAILKSLAELGLALPISDEPRSPNTRGRGLAESIHSSIKFLYFQDRPELDKFVREFKDEHDNATSPPDLLQLLESQLQDLKRLAKDKPKDTPLNDKLRSARAESTHTPRIDGMFKPTKRRSPDGESAARLIPKQQRRDRSWGRSFDSFSTTETRASTSSSLLSRDQSSVRASTAATSFSMNEEKTDELPPSTFDVDFDATQQGLLDDLMIGMDSKDTTSIDNQTHRNRTSPIKATSDVIRAPHDSPQQQLIDELRLSISRESPDSDTATSNDLPRNRHFLLKKLRNERICKTILPATMNNFPFAVKWLIARTQVENEQVNIHDLDQRLKKMHHPEHRLGIAMDWLRKNLDTDEVDRYLGDEAAAESVKTKSTFYRGEMALREKEIRSRATQDRNLLHFRPMGPSDDALSRLERNFGPRRFLAIKFAVSSKVLSDVSDLATFEKDFRRFLRVEQDVLGTTFRCFHLEKRRSGDGMEYNMRYFAIRGPDVTTTTIEEVMDWALNLTHKDNLKQPFAKLMTRLELYLSRTSQAMIFEPHQVKYCIFGSEIRADGAAEPTRFNDTRLKFRELPKGSKPPVMNDGCCTLSPAAARQICENLQLTGDRPSAFQGRINGAKGMWFLSGPYDSQDESVWISINPSQRKVHARPEDLHDLACEPCRWALDVVAYSTMPKSSSLHIDFLPIMEDRGVPRQVLIDVVMEQLKFDFDKFSGALEDPVELMRWIHGALSGKMTKNREAGIKWLGGLPNEDVEKAIYLLEAGFTPQGNLALAGYTFTLLTAWLSDMLSKLKIRSNKTLMPYGVADQKQCLLPGEIFLAFSQPFLDQDTGESYSHLEGDVLIARHPTLRSSDMQRVKAVYKPELSYLRDVVVFPTRGKIPLASKLQGGDYDGDTFWICFDQRIVKHFRNAPAPLEDPKPEQYGIRQNKDTLKDVLYLNGGPRNFENIIHRYFRTRLNDELLGKVTNTHKRLAYQYGNLTDRRVKKLADVHNLIIDAAKNGYEFGEDDFANLMKSIGVPAKNKELTYDEAMKAGLPKAETTFKSMGINDKSILDILVCNFVIPRMLAYQEEMRVRLRLNKGKYQSETADEDLLGPYRELERLATINPTAKINLKILNDRLRALSSNWKPGFGDVQLAPGRYVAVSNSCIADYQSILPVTEQDSLVTPPASSADTSSNPTSTIRDTTNTLMTAEGILVHMWTHKDAAHAPSKWEIIRASALYQHRIRTGTSTKFAFLMGGRELTYLKAMSSGRDSRVATWGIHAVMKPRKPKRKTMWKGRMSSGKSVDSDDDV
ncbi:hypothetical protein CAC42_8153 [Sphaceloma murrayae]|uniref:RNA-dependent RNA polymerase n=1 Tax=Sphaceloma murrayae TaxID=2082308 RepID=A0A2K1QJS8_9PEZI|nr:hypothetical protein CAC42_8153 [Sphaceloma murrayae]